jgi:hypothetical protein
MNSSRSFLLLAGVALLGAIASFNEMMPDAQASVLDATGETAQQRAVATYQAATDKLTDETAQQLPARVLASPQAEGRERGGAPSQRVGARSNAEPSAPAPNPLWALPLERFSITRERPIFSPSRRPPPPPPTYVAPVAVRQPPKPPEPEHPAVSLIGTVIGTDVQIGIFLEQATQNVIRLRLGEEHQGWVLRLVKAGEVTLVKGVAETLALGPPPGAPAARGPSVTPVVPNSIGTTPVVNTADYVDEQPLPRGAQRQQH